MVEALSCGWGRSANVNRKEGLALTEPELVSVQCDSRSPMLVACLCEFQVREKFWTREWRMPFGLFIIYKNLPFCRGDQSRSIFVFLTTIPQLVMNYFAPVRWRLGKLHSNHSADIFSVACCKYPGDASCYSHLSWGALLSPGMRGQKHEEQGRPSLPLFVMMKSK